MSETPGRHIRVNDQTWSAAKKRADNDGHTLSTVINGWLEDYAAGAMTTCAPADLRDFWSIADRLAILATDIRNMGRPVGPRKIKQTRDETRC